ncbi:MAG: hypothetical protein RL477_1461 [Pseudomonadota bacterium]|jgi:tripartite-type tricarboxylate transporter receptor subunit TctC
MRFSILRGGIGAVAAGLFAGVAAFAPAQAEDFYKGKTITLVISAGPGGGYASYVLTTTAHMKKHIPGNPEFVRQHRQGAGGVVAANYLYNAAKRDGTVMAIIHRGAVSTSAVFREKGVKYDPRNFSWIGSITKETSLCVSYHTSPVKTFDDLFSKELIVGGLGPGGDTDVYPNIFNNLFGTRFKLITGYNQGTAITLEMERGEVQGRCGWSWSSIEATQPAWITEKKINFLGISGLSRDPEIPASVPLIGDLAKTQREKDILELAFAPLEMARPLLAPPQVPADRLRILRAAFDKTMKDPEFLAEAKKRKLDVSPISGAELAQLITRLMDKPADIVNATVDAISRKDRMEVQFRKVEEQEVRAKLDAVEDGGRKIVFKAKGQSHEVGISGGRTTISVGGKEGKRGDLKAGMDCTVKYGGNKSTAESVSCR